MNALVSVSLDLINLITYKELTPCGPCCCLYPKGPQRSPKVPKGRTGWRSPGSTQNTICIPSIDLVLLWTRQLYFIFGSSIHPDDTIKKPRCHSPLRAAKRWGSVGLLRHVSLNLKKASWAKSSLPSRPGVGFRSVHSHSFCVVNSHHTFRVWVLIRKLRSVRNRT